MYLAHREERLDQVREALRVLGDDATARQIVEHVYTDVDEELWDAAEWSRPSPARLPAHLSEARMSFAQTDERA